MPWQSIYSILKPEYCFHSQSMPMPSSSRYMIQTSLLGELFHCVPLLSLTSISVSDVSQTLQISSVPHDRSVFMLSANYGRSIKAMAKEDAFHAEWALHGNLQHEQLDSIEFLESKSSFYPPKFYSRSIFHPAYYHCKRLSPGKSKNNSPMCGILIVGIHLLISHSHSLGTITSSQILIYFLPISLSFLLSDFAGSVFFNMIVTACASDFCS